MLVIKNEIENWREHAYAIVSEEVERESFYDEVAEEIRDETLRLYQDAGFDYEITRKGQSVGAFAIVQDGTEAEKDAFRAALDAALDALKPRVAKMVAQEIAADSAAE